MAYLSCLKSCEVIKELFKGGEYRSACEEMETCIIMSGWVMHLQKWKNDKQDQELVWDHAFPVNWSA